MISESILGYQIYKLDISSLSKEILGHISAQNKMKYLACFNPHSYVVALNDKDFANALNQSNWLVPDGVGVIFASAILGGSIKNRITGSDVFYEVNRSLNNDPNKKIFLLGSSYKNLLKMKELISIDFPDLRVAGIYSPPFSEVFHKDENMRIIKKINESGADVLWVGLSAPKQEKWIKEHLHLLNIPFVAAIGAVFDFYTGQIKRSHISLQRIGLEWLPRLIQEPRRLYRRMFVSAPIFIMHVLRDWLRSL